MPASLDSGWPRRRQVHQRRERRRAWRPAVFLRRDDAGLLRLQRQPKQQS